MRRTAIMFAAFIILLSLAATAQENRSEISVQGTGFFTQDTSGQGSRGQRQRRADLPLGTAITSTAGSPAKRTTVYDRNTQRYFSAGGVSRVQSDVHTATAAAAVSLPFRIARLNPYVLGGGGSLVFHPTGNRAAFCPALIPRRKALFSMVAESTTR